MNSFNCLNHDSCSVINVFMIIMIFILILITVRWSEDSYYLKEFLHKYKLPQVIIVIMFLTIMTMTLQSDDNNDYHSSKLILFIKVMTKLMIIGRWGRW